jgi:hypothetical protein
VIDIWNCAARAETQTVLLLITGLLLPPANMAFLIGTCSASKVFASRACLWVDHYDPSRGQPRQFGDAK